MWYKIAFKYWREILIIILLASVILSVKTCNNRGGDIDLLQTANNKLFNEATYYKNKNGDLLGQVKTQELTIQQLRKYSETLGYDIKALKAQTGNLSRLVSHWKGKAGMKDTVFISVKDTTLASLDNTFNLNPVDAKKFTYSNRFLNLTGTLNLENNSLALDYSYQSEFEITAYYKRQGLFKSPQLVTDIYFADPNMRVHEFKGFVVKQEPRGFFKTPAGQLVIGFGAGLATAAIIR